MGELESRCRQSAGGRRACRAPGSRRGPRFADDRSLPRPSRCWRRARRQLPGSSPTRAQALAASASSMMARKRRFVLVAREPVGEARVVDSVSSRPSADISARYCFSLLTASRMMAVAAFEQIRRRPAAHAPDCPTAAGDGRRPTSPRSGPTETPSSPPASRRRSAGPCRYAVALEQRARHAERSGRARQHVAHRKAGARRPGLGMARDRHDAGQRLDLAVIAGP